MELRVKGYKNLRDCVLPMRDFNVIVGPNNSGKSNLLEIFRVLWCLCFGAEEERRNFLRGLPLCRRDPQTPRLWHPQKEALSIGVTFETLVANETWVVDFDLSVKRATTPDTVEGMGFETECLKAKHPSKTGPARVFLRRDGKKLVIDKKEHAIPKWISAVAAVSVLYPEPDALGPELSAFIKDIEILARTTVYALSPENLRTSMQKETPLSADRVSAFGLLPAIDEIFRNKSKLEIFKTTVCNILDLDDIKFDGFDMPLPRGKDAVEKRTQRIRFCVLRGKGTEYAELGEYSDGTLIVTAIVAALVLNDRKKGLTCIEELENCLHPSAQEKLLRFLRENAAGWQLAITTHSPYLVNGVDADDVLVAVVCEDGFTQFAKPTRRREINDLLKRGLMSFGDLMVSNFQDLVDVTK